LHDHRDDERKTLADIASEDGVFAIIGMDHAKTRSSACL
jgi:hypothetical protein